MTAPASRAAGEWYGEFAAENVALSLQTAGGQISGAGWVGYRGDSAWDSGEVSAVTASGTVDPQSGAVHLTLTTRYGVGRYLYTLDGVVDGDRLSVRALARSDDPGHPEAGTLTRSGDARGAATVTAHTTGADPTTWNGDYTGTAATLRRTDGLADQTYDFDGDVLSIHFPAGRPAVGRYVVSPPDTVWPPTVVTAYLFSSTGGGRTSSYSQAFEPDRTAAGEVQVTTSTPYRVAGTYQFTAVLVRNRARQPDHLVVSGEFDVPCLGDCH